MTGWFVAAIAVIAVIWLIRKPRTHQREPNQPVLTSRLEESRTRGASLGTSEQNELVADARDLASRGYDRLYEAASQAGKDEHFAHQAGVLDAAFCVLANDDPSRQDEGIRRDIQMETVPFNNVSKEIGRPAIIEYLIWRIFPSHADANKIKRALDQFVEKVVRDSEDEPDADRFIHEMIFAANAGWRELAIEALRKRAGEKNG